MKKLCILTFLVVFGSTLKIHSHQQQVNAPHLVGGYSSSDPTNLSANQKEIDTYLKSTFPQLNSLKLTNTQTQVVSGMNYKYTYSDDTNNKSYEFIVWDQPWMNNRQITQSKMVQHSVNQNGDQVTTTKTLVPNSGQYIEAAKGLFY